MAVGLVAGGFTGRTIAENALKSSGGASSDSNTDLQADDFPIISGPPDHSQESQTSATNSPSTQQEPPQIFEAPNAGEFSVPETDERSLPSSSPPTGGTSAPTNALGPISVLTSHSPPLYQVSREVGASLTVQEGLLGDVNDDGSVNQIDLVEVSRSFDTRPGEPTLLDVNGDGRVDIFDLATVAAHQGDETPV